MNSKTNRRRMTLRLALAGVAVIGIGAAVTTAVWTDNVFFTATATSSGFDLQGRDPDGAWFDDGIPGDSDTVPIVLATDELTAIAPADIYVVPFELCNVGSTAGTITAQTVPTFAGAFAGATGISVAFTTTMIGTVLPSDPLCATPVAGSVTITTTSAFNLQDTTDTITFDVTGTSD